MPTTTATVIPMSSPAAAAAMSFCATSAEGCAIEARASLGCRAPAAPRLHGRTYDNDGLVDLHALPRGLFRQQRGRAASFQRVGTAKSRREITLGVAQ